MQLFKNTFETLSYVCLVGAFVTACSTTPKVQAIDTKFIGQVQAEIKNQVGVYLIKQNEERRKFVSKQGPKESDFWCGKGNVSYDIIEVEATLTTTNSSTSALNAGAAGIPLSPGTAAITLSMSDTKTNTQALVYKLYPWPYDANRDEFKTHPLPDDALKNAPIASVLLDLTAAQVEAAKRVQFLNGKPTPTAPQPCFWNYDASKKLEAPHTYSIGINVSQSATGGITIALAPFTFGASQTEVAGRGNTLKVKFRQSNVEKLVALENAVAKACEKRPTSKKCASARLALAKERQEFLGEQFN